MSVTGLNSKCRQDVNPLIQVNGNLERGEMSPPLPLNISTHSSSFSPLTCAAWNRMYPAWNRMYPAWNGMYPAWNRTYAAWDGGSQNSHVTHSNKPCWECWEPRSRPPWVMNISMNLDNLHEFFSLTCVFGFFHLYIEKAGLELVIINCFENLAKAVLPSPKAHIHRYRFQLWLYGVREPQWVSGLELFPLWNLT